MPALMRRTKELQLEHTFTGARIRRQGRFTFG